MTCIDHGGPAGDRYRSVQHRGRSTYYHRVVLANKLGIAESELDTARHTCDNKRCINIDHLIPGTQQDNVRDAVDRNLFPHGEAHYAAKLTQEQVDYMRSVYVPRSREFGTRALARRFNVSQWVVSHAIRGLTWRHKDA